MSVLWAVSVGLLVLGPWGLSCVGWSTTARPVEHHEPPAVSQAVAPHDELPHGIASSKLLPPPPSSDRLTAT